jgi:hypothetical protein
MISVAGMLSPGGPAGNRLTEHYRKQHEPEIGKDKHILKCISSDLSSTDRFDVTSTDDREARTKPDYLSLSEIEYAPCTTTNCQYQTTQLNT